MLVLLISFWPGSKSKIRIKSKKLDPSFEWHSNLHRQLLFSLYLPSLSVRYDFAANETQRSS